MVRCAFVFLLFGVQLWRIFSWQLYIAWLIFEHKHMHAFNKMYKKQIHISVKKKTNRNKKYDESFCEYFYFSTRFCIAKLNLTIRSDQTHLLPLTYSFWSSFEPHAAIISYIGTRLAILLMLNAKTDTISNNKIENCRTCWTKPFSVCSPHEKWLKGNNVRQIIACTCIMTIHPYIHHEETTAIKRDSIVENTDRYGWGG